MVARYITYKCKKCGYKFTKYQSDVIIPLNKCPKCGGKLKIINTSMNPSAIELITNLFEKVLNKR